VLRKLVITSFLLALAFTVFSVIVVSQIDSSLGPFGAGIAAILVLGAILFGIADPDTKIDKLYARLALSWVASASRTPVRTMVHLLLMGLVITFVYMSGFGSVHAHVRCSNVISGGVRYKMFWRTLLGKDMETSCAQEGLSPMWVPLVSERKIRVHLARENLPNIDCSIKDNALACPSLDDADYVITSAKQIVNFTSWRPVPPAERRPTSFVHYQFSLNIKRLSDKEFIRWASTTSRFGLNCNVTSKNGDCSQEKPPGFYGETNRRNWQVAINRDRFPLNVPTLLEYEVTYLDAFTFAPAGPDECTGCDVTFYGVYPVSHYEIEMIFPKTWAWRKVTVITTIGGVSNIETIQNRDKHEGFEWTAPGTLKAGTRLIFNVLPESRRAGN
jgi:hypothetical protein